MPTPLLTAILTAGTTATTTKSKSSGGGSEVLLIVLILVAVAYFVFVRPRQRKARAARNPSKALDIGDEVVTIGGILGVVSAVEDDVVTVEVGPGNHMSFLRRAVNPRAAVTGAPVSNPIDEPDEEDAEDASTYDEADGATYDDGDWDDEDAAGVDHDDTGGDHPGDGHDEGESTPGGPGTGGTGEGR